MLKLVTALFFVTACLGGGTIPTDDEVGAAFCRVVRYHIADKTVCSLECAWAIGYRGYATSVPVDCSLHGKPITRE